MYLLVFIALKTLVPSTTACINASETFTALNKLKHLRLISPLTHHITPKPIRVDIIRYEMVLAICLLRCTITILSDTQQILNDLYVYYMDSNDYSFDVVGLPSFQALNNDLLDYAAGYVMNITLTVNDWTDCAVPL